MNSEEKIRICIFPSFPVLLVLLYRVRCVFVQRLCLTWMFVAVFLQCTRKYSIEFVAALFHWKPVALYWLSAAYSGHLSTSCFGYKQEVMRTVGQRRSEKVAP